MHHSRLCAVLIDCRTFDLDAAAQWIPNIRAAAAITACWRPRLTSPSYRSRAWIIRAGYT